MATFQCRVQYLDDTDPFSSTNFPEPTRPPTYTFLTNVSLINQIAGVKRLLKAPHKVSKLGERGRPERVPGRWAAVGGEPAEGDCMQGAVVGSQL